MNVTPNGVYSLCLIVGGEVAASISDSRLLILGPEVDEINNSETWQLFWAHLKQYRKVFADSLNVLPSSEQEAQFEWCFSLANDPENESNIPFEFWVPRYPSLHGLICWLHPVW